MKSKLQNQLILALFFTSAIIVLVVCVYTAIQFQTITRFSYSDTEARILSTSRYASQIVTPQELDALRTPEDMEKPIFAELKERLKRFAEDNGVLYVYYLRNTPDNMQQYIIDNDETDQEVNLSTPPIEWEPKAWEAWGGTVSAEMENYLDNWEHLISAFAPVRDEDGTVVAVAAVDIDDRQILAIRNAMHRAIPLLSAGVLVVIICGLLNVFVHSRTDSERVKALNQATSASHAKSDFLANMSHEIRTPMNAIIGMTSIGMSATDMERMKYCFAKIEDASKHLLGIINDILDMSKIEAGKFELSPTEFNFEKMLQRVVSVVSFRIDERQQKLTVYIDRAIPKVLVGDDQRLAQVITNLLGNAIKFTPEKGFIRIGTQFLKEENGVCHIQIFVQDTGIGISPEQQSRLFKSFQQAESNTTRKFGGTGLGLSISKSIVDMMGGKIWIESEIGAGSKFAFTIQMKRGKEEETASPGWGDIRLLAVDNDPYVLSHFDVIAKGFNVPCDTAENYSDAVRLITQGKKYDFCFVNQRLNVGDGLELAALIKERQASATIVLMISALKWIEVEERAKKLGVNKFLSKPLFPSSIAGIINECLGMDHQQQDKDAQQDVAGLFAGRHILLAEDIEINREIVLALLAPTLLVIDCAENGKQALEMFSQAQGRYDMIFMDVQMPEMDGYKATAAIRALDTPKAKSIPIIAMTASVFKEDIEKCMASGMDGHLGKPLNLDEVLDKLRKYLL